MLTHISSSLKKNRGSSLLEVLVAIVVLSVGMLGIAGLQVATAKYLQGARARSAVAPLLSDITNRVRSNADQAGNNAATGTASISAYGLAKTWSDQQTTTPVVSKNCEDAGTACTPTEKATYDMAIWAKRVHADLPGGAGLLSGNRSQGFDVTLMWFDKEMTDKGKNKDSQLIKANVCSTATEVAGSNRMGQQNCCPQEAQAPVGVRCTRYTFIP